MPDTPPTNTNTNTIVGTPADVVLGTGEFATSGYIKSGRAKRGSERILLPGNDAWTTAKIYFDMNWELELEVYFQEGTTVPDPGTAITIFGIAGDVDNAEAIGTEKQLMTMRVNASKHDGVTRGTSSIAPSVLGAPGVLNASASRPKAPATKAAAAKP